MLIHETDKELKALAAEEISQLEKERSITLEHIQNLMLQESEEEGANTAIMEIRPGTGGIEAALFASELLTMYQRFAANNNYKFDTVSIQQNQQGGIKEAIVTIEGDRAFARLEVESGVHRVQRIPETEAQGRIHTSAATVAVPGRKPAKHKNPSTTKTSELKPSARKAQEDSMSIQPTPLSE